jgi:hypothetical protein
MSSRSRSDRSVTTARATQRAVVSRTDAATSSPSLRGLKMSRTVTAAVPPRRRYRSTMASEPASSSNVPVLDGICEVGSRAPKQQLVVDEQAEACACAEREERRVVASSSAPERLLAEHREIHVVLNCNIRPEAAAQIAEDIEVLQSRDVWNQRNTTCARIDRSRDSHHDMTRRRDFDPDGSSQLVGAGGDLFGHVRSAAWVRGLG